MIRSRLSAPVDLRSASDLRSYQKDFARFCNDGEESIGYVEMGLGKTSSWLWALKERIDENPRLRCLVIAPRAVALSVWGAEAQKWDFSYSWRVRTAAAGTWAWRQKVLSNPKNQIVTINCEMVPKMVEAFRGQLPFDVVLFDEIDKFKSASSKRYKAILPTTPQFRTRMGGTGTLVSEGLDDTYGPSQLVTAGKAWPGLTHDKWRKRYFYRNGGGPKGVGGKWLPQARAEYAIMSRISPLIFRARADDHLDLPDMVVKPYVIPMPPSMKGQYKELLNRHRLQIAEGEKVSMLQAVAVQMKLRQLCSGFIYSDPEVDMGSGAEADVSRITTWLYKNGGPKFEMLRDLLEELGHEQALVMTQFIAEREMLKVPWLSGSMPAAKMNALIHAWNAGVVRRMSGHPRSMGHGVNLQEGGAHHIVWLSLPWSRSEFDQANARLQRMGQKNTVFCHVLMMEGSVDQVVFEALQRKADVRLAVDQYLRAH